MFKQTISLILLMFCVNIAAYALRDPTRPYDFKGGVASEERKQLYVLSSILVSRHRRLVVVNGELLKVGDEIQGAKVLAIKKHAVVLAVGDVQTTIPLVQRKVKQPVSKRMSLEELRKKM